MHVLKLQFIQRLDSQELHLSNLQRIIQYWHIIPNDMLLFINTCRGFKPMYNLLLDKWGKYVHPY